MTAGMRPVKYADKEILKKLNDHAVMEEKNRALVDEVFDLLPDDDTLYPVVIAFIHNECEMRLGFAANVNGKLETLIIDVDFDFYNYLPNAEVPVELTIASVIEDPTDGRVADAN